MNTNRNKVTDGQSLFLIVLMLTVFLSSSCAAQNNQKPPEKIVPKTVAASSFDRAGCQPSAERSAELPSEWKGSDLHKAVNRLDTRGVENLLRRNADVNEKDNYGDSPLINIVTPRVGEASKLPPGVRPDAQTREKQRLQKVQEEQSQLKILGKLLARGADPNQKNARGETPLMIAASFGYHRTHAIKLLTLLLQSKADVNAQDERGFTALMRAASANNAEIVKFLLVTAANPHLVNCAGKTALAIAEAENSSEAVKILKQLAP